MPWSGGASRTRGNRPKWESPPLEPAFLPLEIHAVGFQLLQLETRWQGEFGIEREQCINAAPRSRADDAHQPPRGGLVEVAGKVGHDQHSERLGHLAGVGVVFLDRLELIAQVLLDHIFHVSLKVGEPLLDVRRLGPDPAGDQELVIIGQVHEGREVLSQPDRVEDGESDLAGRNGREEPKHECLEQLDRLTLGGVAGLDQHRRLDRERDQRGQFQSRRTSFLEPFVDGHPAVKVAQVDREGPEWQGRWNFRGRRPAVECLPVPVEKSPGRFRVDLVGQVAHPGETLGPGRDQFGPRLVVKLGRCLLGGSMSLLKLPRILLVLLRACLDPGRKMLLCRGEVGFALLEQTRQSRGIGDVGFLPIALLAGLDLGDPARTRSRQPS